MAKSDVSLARIASSRGELGLAVGLIEAVTAGNKDARTLQLESTLDALAKARAGVDALNKVERPLADPDQRLPRGLPADDDAITGHVAFLGVFYDGSNVEAEASGATFPQLANLGNNRVRLHRRSPTVPAECKSREARTPYYGRCVRFAAASKGWQCACSSTSADILRR